MPNNKILKKIRSGEVKMKPRWEFVAWKWGEITLWLGSIGIVVGGAMTVAYFLTVYNPQELAEFGDLGWQVFYEDFPYIWSFVAIASLIFGGIVMVKTGNNYKRSWQKNLMIMSGIILVLTIGALFLGL